MFVLIILIILINGVLIAFHLINVIRKKRSVTGQYQRALQDTKVKRPLVDTGGRKFEMSMRKTSLSSGHSLEIAAQVMAYPPTIVGLALVEAFFASAVPPSDLRGRPRGFGAVILAVAAAVALLPALVVLDLAVDVDAATPSPSLALGGRPRPRLGAAMPG